jgi:hypothetical protein
MAKVEDIYVTLTDFTGQRYVAAVDSRAPATSASLGYERTPEQALAILRQQIVEGHPIACEIVHPNNRGKCLTVFYGPVTLTHHYNKDNN